MGVDKRGSAEVLESLEELIPHLTFTYLGELVHGFIGRGFEVVAGRNEQGYYFLLGWHTLTYAVRCCSEQRLETRHARLTCGNCQTAAEEINGPGALMFPRICNDTLRSGLMRHCGLTALEATVKSADLEYDLRQWWAYLQARERFS